METFNIKLIPRIETKGRIFQNFHFWSIVAIILFLVVFYYQNFFFGHRIFYFFWALELAEFNYNLIGSLFFIPIIYATVIFSLRGTLITWLISLGLILPKILTFRDDFASHITNVFFLLIPLLIVVLFSIELSWREKERKNLTRREAEREAERQIYVSQIFKAQEDERKRISQEIHDDSIQRLASVASMAQIISHDKLVESHAEVKEQIEYLKQTIISISQDLRRLSLDLRPTVLDDLGLIPSLCWLVDRLKQESGINARIDVIGNNQEITGKVTVQIFRIVQEALNNARRHSQASNVIVTLQIDNNGIKVTIKDDGQGFTLPKRLEALATGGRLGLIGMQQRVQELNGKFNVQSAPGKGTTISIEVGL